MNLLIINSLLLKEGLSSTQSHSIITTMQVIGAEKPEICCTIFVSFLQKIKVFNKQNLPVQYQHLDFVFFHLNDAKMFYSLTQHSSFNRLGYPYLQCSCKQDGVQVECNMLTDDQYSKAWRKSSKHFDKILDKKI